MKRLGIINIDFGKLSGLMDLPEGHEVVDVRVLEWFEYGGREKVVQVEDHLATSMCAYRYRSTLSSAEKGMISTSIGRYLSVRPPWARASKYPPSMGSKR